jgi:hypothetical protein
MKQKICPANQNMEKEDYALKDISSNNQKSDKKMSRNSSKVQVE